MISSPNRTCRVVQWAVGGILAFALRGATAQEAAAPVAQPAPDLASNPALAPTTINPALPTLFIAGDSTAARGQGVRQQGWGVPFADYFDRSKVNVVNRARGGRSSRTYYTERLWAHLLADVKPGDVVLIQFGHNDGSAPNQDRARGSLPGLGEETLQIDNILTHAPETVHTFGWYMRTFISEAKAKGAQPIVLSPTVRNIWKDGKIERGPGSYPRWSEQIAQAAHIPFLDISGTMADVFQAKGSAETAAIYQQDHTHFNLIGADWHARAVVAGLAGLEPRPISAWLSAKGQAVLAEGKSN